MGTPNNVQCEPSLRERRRKATRARAGRAVPAVGGMDMFDCCISRQSADDEIAIRRRDNEYQIKIMDFASNVSFPCHGAKRAAGPAKNPAPFFRPDVALAPSFFQDVMPLLSVHTDQMTNMRSRRVLGSA